MKPFLMDHDESFSEALTKLPDAQRETMVLHYLHGLTLAEVATETGRTEAAVARLIFRGLQTLQSLIREEGSGNGS